MPDNLRHAQYDSGGTQLDDPQEISRVAGLQFPNYVTTLYKNNPTTIPAASVQIALGISNAQSNERGQTTIADALGNAQNLTISAPSQGIFEPTPSAPAGFGSMITVACELLALDGVKVNLFNGAVGDTSGPLDWCGWVNLNGRANNTAYRGRRNSLGTGDPGHRGDMIHVNGATWEASVGNRHLVFVNSDTPITCNGGSYWIDPGSIIKETNLVTAGAPPVFPGVPIVGDTVVDGAITWECIEVGALTVDVAGIHIIRVSKAWFDVYGMHNRVRSGLMKIRVASTKRFVLLQNGQSDAGINQNVYRIAMQFSAQYYGQSPYAIQPIFSLSIFSPSQTQAVWDSNETVMSGGGLGTTANYTTSILSVGLNAAGYHLATPGVAITNFGYYYITPVYRAFGTNVTALLETGGPHTNPRGMLECGAHLARQLSPIFRNTLTGNS